MENSYLSGGLSRVKNKRRRYARNGQQSSAQNGPGIPPAVREKLFQAFQSAKSSRGTGLGLAVTKKIAEEHHGEVLVETREGAGTRFTVRLPVDRPARKTRAAGAAAGRPMSWC